MARHPTWPPRITLHAATGQARVNYRGTAHYLGPFNGPQVQERYAALLVQLAEAGSGVSGPLAATPCPPILTVAEVAERFLTAAETERPAGQHARYAVALRVLVRVCGQVPAAEFDDVRLEAVRLAMLTGSWLTETDRAKLKGRLRHAGWCRTNAARHVARIKTVWRWAERRKLVPPGSWGNLRALLPLSGNLPGVRESPRRRATSRADLDAVLPHVQRNRRHRPAAAMLELQHITGMRSGEVCVMRPCDIDRETGPTFDGVKVWLYRPHAHKTAHLGHTRIIALGPAAQAILAPWLLSCPADDAYLFRPRTSARYSVVSYAKCIAHACERAGVKIWAYGGRRATADRVRRAAGLETARAVLGHATTAETEGYCNIGDELDIEAAARVAARLG